MEPGLYIPRLAGEHLPDVETGQHFADAHWCIPAGLLNRSQKLELLWLIFLRFWCRILFAPLGLIDLQREGRES